MLMIQYALNGIGAYLAANALVLSSGGNTIQIFSIVAGAAIVVIAGLFTIRAKNAEWWQQSYEGVKAAHAEEKVTREKWEKEALELRAENKTLKAMPNYDLLVEMLQRQMAASEKQGDANTAALEKLTRVLEERLPRGGAAS